MFLIILEATDVYTIKTWKGSMNFNVRILSLVLSVKDSKVFFLPSVLRKTKSLQCVADKVFWRVAFTSNLVSWQKCLASGWAFSSLFLSGLYPCHIWDVLLKSLSHFFWPCCFRRLTSILLYTGGSCYF